MDAACRLDDCMGARASRRRGGARARTLRRRRPRARHRSRRARARPGARRPAGQEARRPHPRSSAAARSPPGGNRPQRLPASRATAIRRAAAAPSGFYRYASIRRSTALGVLARAYGGRDVSGWSQALVLDRRRHAGSSASASTTRPRAGPSYFSGRRPEVRDAWTILPIYSRATHEEGADGRIVRRMKRLHRQATCGAGRCSTSARHRFQ